jgi:hypothetical protein
MVKMVMLDSWLPFAKNKPLSANASSNLIRHLATILSCPRNKLLFAIGSAAADFSRRERSGDIWAIRVESAKGHFTFRQAASEGIFRSIYQYSWRLYGYAHAHGSEDSGD